MEQWKDIPDTDSYYQISTHGRIRSWKNGRWGRRDNPKIIKLGYCRRGYIRYALNYNGDKRNYSLHRLVAEMFIPNPEHKPQVNHKDGVKTNNHVENLDWVTDQENVDHAHANGLFNYTTGADNKNSSLSEIQAAKIRLLYKSTNLTQRQIADAYLVSQGTIGSITNKKYY